MGHKKLSRLLLVVFILTFSHASFAFEQWWQCSSRKGGDWSFGRAPSICLVDHMQKQSTVRSQYNSILFFDNLNRTVERKRYMTELNAVAKEIASYYLKRRKPSVSSAEINAFTWGLLALMHQETVWSHYREYNDELIRYMRGDSGHGHGLMQVDDRSHQEALLEGRGVDLIHNMIYGLDVFYAAWQNAPSASCVNSPTDYKNRIRSAWSAYNGGPARICRWTSTTGTFAEHDKQFLAKLNNKAWENHVTDQSKKTELNIHCLAEGTRPCANNGSVLNPNDLKLGEVYQVGSGLYCLNQSARMECVDRVNDLNCLSLRDNKNYTSLGFISSESVDKPLTLLDRNGICQSSVDNLFEISQSIKTNKRINIRKTPGGELLATSELDYTTQVLDFEVTSLSDQARHYKINFNGVQGYIYAGNQNDFMDWVSAVDELDTPSIIANIGEAIKVVAPFGINLRQSPGGTLLVRVPKDEVLQVLDRVVQGSQNYLYYQVQYQNQLGYVYSGNLVDESSVLEWTQVIHQEQNTFALKDDLQFRFLKQCSAADCGFSQHFLLPKEELKVVLKQGEWVQVESLVGGKSGWIREIEIKQFGS